MLCFHGEPGATSLRQKETRRRAERDLLLVLYYPTQTYSGAAEDVAEDSPGPCLYEFTFPKSLTLQGST